MMPTTVRTCRLVTLGCKVNQYETQYVKEALEINGYFEAADGLFHALMLVFLAVYTPAQTTIATGSIQGTVTDPAGAVVVNAKVIITSLDTNQVRETTTSSSGNFTSGSLLPGEYRIRVQAPGFSDVESRVTVQISTTTAANIQMSLHGNAEVVEVRGGGASQVNTEQATVQGVLNAEQIDTLPINGRNFLDLAQLEPGVQVQDGANFDPTKGGFSGISVGAPVGPRESA